MDERERKAGTVPTVTASTERREVAVVRMLSGGARQERKAFHFDHVFGSFSTQTEVFQATLKPLVREVLSGFEATAFAYGQTGTGKTFTMEGDVDSEDNRGLVPRAAGELFGELSTGGFAEYSVTVSYLEIYNEELGDLLAPECGAGASAAKKQHLDLKDAGASRGVCCLGLSEVPVYSVADVLEQVRTAQERRRVAETRINARSSRSHCIFTMTVRCRREVSVGVLENVGKLHLVDLAGSECAKKASDAPVGATGVASAATTGIASEVERERRNINQSLLTLGRVITALRESSNAGPCAPASGLRVPYRDSKLTRILQDALGGRCKTVIIATISPAMLAVDETISTLTYADQASGIRNKPVAQSLLKSSRAAASLGGLDAAGLLASDWAEMEMKNTYMTQEVEESQFALAKTYQELQALQATFAEAEYVQSRTSALCRQGSEAAVAYAAAFGAARAHGEGLAARLQKELEKAIAVQEQAIALCEATATEAQAQTLGVQARCGEATAAMKSAGNAHDEALNASFERLRMRRAALEGLIVSVRDTDGRLTAKVPETAAEVRNSLDQSDRSTAEGLAAVCALGAAVKDAASKGRADVLAAADKGLQDAAERTDAIVKEIAGCRQTVAALCEQSAEELTSMREAASAAAAAANSRLVGTVQEPLGHLREALEADVAITSGHSAEIGSTPEQQREANLAASGRRQQLIEALGTCAAEHAVAAVSRPSQLRAAFAALEDALTSKGSGTAELVAAVSNGLSSSCSSLTQSTKDGKNEVLSTVTHWDALLAAGKEETRIALEALAAALAESVAHQRRDAKNSSAMVCTSATEASTALATSLASSCNELNAARDAVAREVADLRAQRAKESEVVALLTEQRSALEAGTAAARQALAETRGELEAARGATASLEEAQALGRQRALEVVTTALAGLGSELGTSAASIRQRLDNAEVAAARSAMEAEAAVERGTKIGRNAVSTATAWSEAIGAGCEGLAAAEVRTGEATRRIEVAAGEAEGRFAAIANAGETWSSECEQVACQIDEAVVAVGTVKSAGEALQPKFASARDDAAKAVNSWAARCDEITSSLTSVISEHSAAADELTSLRSEVSAQLAVSKECAVAWANDAVSTDNALGAIKVTAANLAEEAGQADELREIALHAFGDVARSISVAAGQRLSHATQVSQALAAHLEASPKDVEPVSRAAAAAATALAEGLQGAETRLASIDEGALGLRTFHADAARAVSASATEAAGAVTDASRKGVAAAEACCSEVASSLQSARSAVQSLQAECDLSIAGLRVAADECQDAAATAAAAEAERAAAEREAVELSELAAMTALEAAAAASVAAIDAQLSAVRAGLAAKPLAAFAPLAEKDALVAPWPCSAGRPEVALPAELSEEELAGEFRQRQDVENRLPTPVKRCCATPSPGEAAPRTPPLSGGKASTEATSPGRRAALSEVALN